MAGAVGGVARLLSEVEIGGLLMASVYVGLVGEGAVGLAHFAGQAVILVEMAWPNVERGVGEWPIRYA